MTRGHQSIYFSLVGPMSLGSVSQPRVAGGNAPGGGWGAGRGGGRERRKRASHPVNRDYTHQIGGVGGGLGSPMAGFSPNTEIRFFDDFSIFT